MKTLPNISIDEIQALSMEKTVPYKNKFISYQVDKNKVTLTFFLNPYSNYSRHKTQATRRLKALWQENNLKGYNDFSLAEIKYDNNLTIYIYNAS